ncbi:MAG: HAD family phosphatase [Lachnospiraceae bacterium]|nr:HAD family phosphatase [Lachnospiraceae bacterium]
MGISAVIFDMDGVIFDSERLVIECWKVVADKYGIDNIEEACFECLGINAALTKELMKKRYGETFPYDAYKKEMSAIFHSRAAGGKLPQKKGIKELLTFLKENHIPTAVASSTRREVVIRELEEGGLLPYFDRVICGDMVERSKPEPDIFFKACESLSVDATEAYAIEDSYNGIRAAFRAGMKPIMVPDLAEPTEEMEKLTCCILPSLFEVMAYLKGRSL